MHNITIKASRLAFVKSAGSSSWDASCASQGAYGTGSPRVGAILFPDLRDVDWAQQDIHKITLKLTFAASGGGRTKTIGLYRGTKTAIDGTGSAMRGTAIGQYVTADTAYNKTIVNEFSAAKDAGTFDGLCGWLQNDSATTLVLYMDEQSGGSDYSRNYCKVTAAELNIDYDLAGSGGKLDKDSVDAGETVTLTISPMSAEGAVTHAVQWRMGGMQSDMVQLGAAVTTSYTIPMDWLHTIPDAANGDAECILTTYVGGAVRSARSVTFTVTVPATVVPTLTAAITPDKTTGGYYQHLGGAKITAAAQGLYGADIAHINIAGSEGAAANGGTLVTPAFADSGAHSYTVTATDTRGRKTTKTLTISVNKYTPPAISVFSAQRYISRIDDDGNTVYTASPAGEKVWFDINAAVDPAGGNNEASIHMLYGPVGASQQLVSPPWPAGSYAFAATNARDIMTATVGAGSSWEFQLVVVDKHTNVTATVRVGMSRAPAHYAGSGYGAAFGGFSGGTALAPELRSYWPIYGPDGYRVDATAAYHEYDADEIGDAWNIKDPLIVSRIGGLVQLEGTLEAVAKIDAGSTSVPIVTLPEWARPRTDQRHVMRPGYSLSIWECSINADGAVLFGHNQVGGEAAAFPATRSARIQAMWFAADAVKPIERRVYVVANLTRCALDNPAETAVVGAAYSVNIVADDGYALASVRVYMSGEDVTADVLSGAAVSIAAVTGQIVIEAVASVGSGIAVAHDGGTVTITAAAGVVQVTHDGNGKVTINNIADMPVSYKDGKVTIG